MTDTPQQSDTPRTDAGVISKGDWTFQITGKPTAATQPEVLSPRNGYTYERIYCRTCAKPTKYERRGFDLVCRDCCSIHCTFHAPEATKLDVKNFLERKHNKHPECATKCQTAEHKGYPPCVGECDMELSVQRRTLKPTAAGHDPIREQADAAYNRRTAAHDRWEPIDCYLKDGCASA